jgi:hypothetical protein
MKGVFLPPSTAEFVLPYHSSVFSISGVSSATLGSLGLEYLLRMNQKNILSLERLNQNKTKKKLEKHSWLGVISPPHTVATLFLSRTSSSTHDDGS